MIFRSSMGPGESSCDVPSSTTQGCFHRNGVVYVVVNLLAIKTSFNCHKILIAKLLVTEIKLSHYVW